MDSYLLNVHKRDKGHLQQERTASYNRFIYSIRNSYSKAGVVQHVGFVKISLDATGSLLAAVDSSGKIFLFDLYDKKFHLVYRLDQTCTALAFFTHRDLVVATIDRTIAFIDTISCTIRKSAQAHRTTVSNIFVNAQKTKAVTSSVQDAAVWDLNTLTLLHRLAISKSVDILKVIFIPINGFLLSAFKDNSVFLWDSAFQRAGNFTCSIVSESPWLRAIDISRDGTIIACSGRVHWVSLWCAKTCSLMHNISFSKYLTTVKQISFLSFQISENDSFKTVGVLSSHGKLYICDIEELEDVYNLPTDKKIDSFTENGGVLSVLTAEWTLDVYDLALVFKKKEAAIKEVPKVKVVTLSPKTGKQKMFQKDSKVTHEQLINILYASGEYPEKHRLFIWSELLLLPKNEEFILLFRKVQHTCFSNFQHNSQTVRKALSRLVSMLYIWCPVLKEVDYIVPMVLPFLQLFHQNLRFCFELAVTYISNWCQNWFLYLPCEPFNILCAAENLLHYHDRDLLYHLLMLEVSPEVYGFSLLKTSFSKVFIEDQWLSVWDHIFSNQPNFLLHAVVAFSISSREVLMRCKTAKEVEAVYSKNCCLASKVMHIAYQMVKNTPHWCDPAPIIGSFCPLPKDGYPVFLRFASTVPDLQTLSRHKAAEEEIDHITHNIIGRSDSIKLSELIRLQDLRRDLILQCAPGQQVEYLESLDEKLKRVQHLIHSILTNGNS